MSTTIDKLSKYGVRTMYEFDNDQHTSLKAIRDTVKLPIWSPQWAFSFTKAEREFERLEEIGFFGSLSSIFCCGKDCDRCTLRCCSRDDDDDEDDTTSQRQTHDSLGYLESANSAVKLKNLTLYEESRLSEKRIHKRISENAGRNSVLASVLRPKIPFINPWYVLGYIFHVLIRLPLYYLNIFLIGINAVTFRIARRLMVRLSIQVRDCPACIRMPINWAIFPLLRICYASAQIVTVCLVYFFDLLSNILLFRPIMAMGLATQVALRNQVSEPVLLNHDLRAKIEEIFADWAWASNMLLDDPRGLDLGSTMRVPIIQPKLLLASFTMISPMVTQTLASETIIPFIMQLMIVWVIFWQLWYTTSGFEEGGYQPLNRCLATGAFFYYAQKAFESAGKFTLICRGHTNNIFLMLDLVSNVIFPYFLLPLAVQIVLDSEGLDLVLNMIAIDFVTKIDEDLLDESVKFRCQPPYCFVFKVKFLPSRTMGLWKTKALEPVLLVEVWSEKTVQEQIDPEKPPVQTRYWMKDEDLSQFEAKLHDTKYLEIIAENIKRSEWNTNNGFTREAKRNLTRIRKKSETRRRARSRMARWRVKEKQEEFYKKRRRTMHLRLTNIPPGASKRHIMQALGDCEELKPLGNCLWISYLDPPRTGQQARGCGPAWKEKMGSASAFFENPDAIPTAIARFDARGAELRITLKDRSKPYELNVYPMVPIKMDKKSGIADAKNSGGTDDDDDEDDKDEIEHQHLDDMETLWRYFEPILKSNYKTKHQLSARNLHMKCLGKKIQNEEDSRVMIVYDFPFVFEGALDKDWLRDPASNEGDVKQDDAKEKEDDDEFWQDNSQDIGMAAASKPSSETLSSKKTVPIPANSDQKQGGIEMKSLEKNKPYRTIAT